MWTGGTSISSTKMVEIMIELMKNRMKFCENSQRSMILNFVKTHRFGAFQTISNGIIFGRIRRLVANDHIKNQINDRTPSFRVLNKTRREQNIRIRKILCNIYDAYLKDFSASSFTSDWWRIKNMFLFDAVWGHSEKHFFTLRYGVHIYRLKRDDYFWLFGKGYDLHLQTKIKWRAH